MPIPDEVMQEFQDSLETEADAWMRAAFAEFSDDASLSFDESKHKRDHGKFAKTEGEQTDHESILKRYSKKLSEAADKIPLIGRVKRAMTNVMSGIHAKAAERYGPKTAAAIMGSGVVMDMLLMGGGTALTGVPVVTGFNQFAGIIPAFALAELWKQLGGKRFAIEEETELSEEEFNAACKAVAKAILRAFRKLVTS